jgi:hypothetical protein
VAWDPGPPRIGAGIAPSGRAMSAFIAALPCADIRGSAGAQARGVILALLHDGR